MLFHFYDVTISVKFYYFFFFFLYLIWSLIILDFWEDEKRKCINKQLNRFLKTILLTMSLVKVFILYFMKREEIFKNYFYMRYSSNKLLICTLAEDFVFISPNRKKVKKWGYSSQILAGNWNQDILLQIIFSYRFFFFKFWFNSHVSLL